MTLCINYTQIFKKGGLYMIAQCFQVMFVSVICYEKIKCHKLSHLKQHTLSHSFCGSGIWAQLKLGCLLQDLSEGCNQGASEGWGLIRKLSWGRICFSVHLGRSWQHSILFWVVGLRGSVSSWLLAKGHPRILAVWTFQT